MPESIYGKPLKNGNWPIEHLCPTCGAKPQRPCWDLRSAIGLVTRVNPHPARGRDEAKKFTPPPYQQKLANSKYNKGTRGCCILTERNMQVLLLICEGLDDKSIARRLDCPFSTAHHYVRDVLWRMGANSKQQAVNYAYRFGVLTVTPEEAESDRAEHRFKFGHAPEPKRKKKAVLR